APAARRGQRRGRAPALAAAGHGRRDAGRHDGAPARGPGGRARRRWGRARPPARAPRARADLRRGPDPVSQPGSPAFELRGVSKLYGGQRTVASVDLAIERGKTTVLIGPSGCGKSTLLRLMVGLVAADEGTVRFDGAAVTPQTAIALRRRMGYVIQ